MGDPIKREFDGRHRIHLFQQILLNLAQDLVALFFIQGPALQVGETVQFGIGNPRRIAAAFGLVVLMEGCINEIRTHAIELRLKFAFSLVGKVLTRIYEIQLCRDTRLF